MIKMIPNLLSSARILPASAVSLLHRAVMIDPEIPAGMSYRRRVALDEATEAIKQKHPQFFKPE